MKYAIVVLSIFLCASGWAQEIALPKAEQPKRAGGEIIVNVKKDGTIVAEGKELSSEKLLKILSEVARKNKDQAVILRGDREAPYKHVVAVLDICQKAGIWNISFATTAAKKTNRDPKAELEKTLPKADPGRAKRVLRKIAIGKDGALSLDGKTVGLAQLENKLAATKKKSDGKLEIVLSADDEGKTERFVEVINLLGKLEISNITMTGFREEAE